MTTSSFNVGLFSPSGIIEPETTKSGISKLENLGFRVHYSESIFDKKRFFAGNSSSRAKELIDLLNNPKIDFLLAARGGSGCIQILPELDREVLSEKPIFGFSDLSTLLTYFNQKRGWLSVHGPVLSSLEKLSDEEIQSWATEVESVLTRDSSEKVFDGISCLRKGEVKNALLAGGNLTTLCSLIGTPWQADLEGKVLFLEDVGETPYRVERLFCQLYYSGMLKGIKGLILGDFSLKGSDLISTGLLWEIAQNYVSNEIPVIGNFPIGHLKRNVILVLGARYDIKVKDDSAKFRINYD